VADKVIGFTLKVNGIDQTIKSIDDLDKSIEQLEDTLKSAEFGSTQFKAIEQDLIKAKIRQNLVYLCKGNPFEMAKLIAPPDFSGFMWKKIQQEYVRKAASLWDKV